MGNRLSKITTRTGDAGDTGLGDGSRCDKDDIRIQCIGEVDELNSWVGMLRASLPQSDDVQPLLSQVQHDLFDVGGELAMPGYTALNEQMILELESALDALNASLPAMKDFILPGGDESTARCHLARTSARRCERSVVTLMRRDDINPHILQYLNRLSDLLFVLARSLARRNGGTEVLWQTRRHKNA